MNDSLIMKVVLPLQKLDTWLLFRYSRYLTLTHSSLLNGFLTIAWIIIVGCYVVTLGNAYDKSNLALYLKEDKQIKKLIIDFKLQPYDEDKRTGLIRHVLVKRSSKTKEILVKMTKHPLLGI